MPANDPNCFIPGFDGRKTEPRPAFSSQLRRNQSSPSRLSACRKAFGMKAHIKIAVGLAALGLVVACSNADNDNPRDIADAAGEPVGEIGVLTDVPSAGVASQSDVVNGSVATEAPGTAAASGPDGRTPPSRSTTNPSPPASTSSPNPSGQSH